jgi:hypothetical protein
LTLLPFLLQLAIYSQFSQSCEMKTTPNLEKLVAKTSADQLMLQAFTLDDRDHLPWSELAYRVDPSGMSPEQH